MKIYVASSWRNEQQQEVVKVLRNAGHEVYDFKNPSDGVAGFSWSEIDPNWEQWTNEEYLKALSHPNAQHGFNRDYDAMIDADACVLVMPCGRSAHSEAGWMQGQDKPVVVLIEKKAEPELMYKLFDAVVDNLPDVLKALDSIKIEYFA